MIKGQVLIHNGILNTRSCMAREREKEREREELFFVLKTLYARIRVKLFPEVSVKS